jgi:fructokinase
VAWDRIEAPHASARAGSLLYHGSLALRDPVSRAALQSLRAALDCTVFLDVNLRPPWYRIEQVLDWVSTAHWAKLNEDEFAELAAAAALPGAADPLPLRAERFLEAFGLAGLIVTRGGAGALLLTEDGTGLEAAAAPSREPLVDTVGAGDAFSSVLILGLLRGWAPEHGLDRALDFAAAICGRRGATVSDPDFYARYRRQWGLDGLGFEHV